MNVNSKKHFFSKRNIIIGIVVLLLVGILIFCFLTRKSKDNVLHCTIPITEDEYVDIDVTVDIYYSSIINKLDGTMNYKIINEELKNNIDALKENLTDALGIVFRGNQEKFSVSKEDSTIIISYSIDYDRYDDSDANMFGLSSLDNDNREINIKELVKSIEKSGGMCVEK